MLERVLSVYTFKSTETIIQSGGTQSWKLDPARAAACTYALMCRNKFSPFVEGTEEHQHAFMIGKIRDVVPSTETAGRWLVRFSEYAEGDWGAQWDGRNPVAYYTTDDFSGKNGFKKIDFDKVVFKPMPDQDDVAEEDAAPTYGRLTIAEAKAGLAATYGVAPINVEICIRG